MKRLSITELEDKLVLKVEHQVKGMVSAVSVFLVNGGEVQEIMPGILSKADEEKIISRDYDRVATKEEVKIADQILEARNQYVLERVNKTIQATGGILLLRMIEMGGRYFAYTTHDNLLYTRFAEVVLTPDELPIDFTEVPLEFLPLLAENISAILMRENKKSVTIQFGEGLFIRLKRITNRVFGTVLRLDDENGQGKLRAPLAFLLKQVGGEWVYQQEEMLEKERMEAEMEKALNHVLNELALYSMKK